MSLPQPVTGPDICPTCKGKRVLQIGTGKTLANNDFSAHVLFGDDDIPYGWCATCRGEGTASAAMELLLIK